ncbi:DUF5677 domain-containing protein [Pseudobutyrivibrio ruminis]|uniref:Uncharacterized protein n=1 Tax=Pseudobutyrivibrio ruminis TaxID=46206 RepID=A0A2G3DTZ5_9FIRM|nr:DUF5677 domain-containing protein [Pseudobutyrivibrio ruminis]PHU34411.1 hypothetical protein CSX01_10145 [Pseudobutyrivibrio ruminis]
MYPEYTDVIRKYCLNDVESLITEIEEQLLGAIKGKQIQEKQDDLNLLLHATMKSISFLREILLMCRHGFPDGALILARNLYEQMIICLFIIEKQGEEHDRILENYYADYECTRLKYIIEGAKRFNDEKQINETKEKLEEHKKKYGSKHNAYWWSEKRCFNEIEDIVINADNPLKGLFNNMHMEYRTASILVHPSCFSNMVHIGSPFKGIDMRAQREGHEESLFLATTSMIPLVGHTYERLGLDFGEVVDGLNRYGIYYWEIVVERNGTKSSTAKI